MISYEIERKFLVDTDPGIIMNKNYTEINQNYFLSGKFLQGRIRREKEIIIDAEGVKKSTTERLFIMFKVRFKKPVEIIIDLNYIPQFLYKRLKTYTVPTKKTCLSKKRFFFGKWMLDVFITNGALPEGSDLLEIELSKQNETLPPFPEGLEVIKEVTDDQAFYNHQIYRKHAS